MVLWLHTSSQTKPNLLQIWTKEERCSEHRGAGRWAARCWIHALQYIPLLVYHEGSELNLPLETVFLSVCIRTLKENLGLYQGRFFFFDSPFFFYFYFSFVVEANPNPPTVST